MRTYIKSLDGLRGLAALAVMWFHFFLNKHNLPDGILGGVLENTRMLGQCGVDLFFVLSGFLITRILLVETKEDGYFKRFYFKRTLRIFPLYYFFLLISYVIYPYLKGGGVIPLSECWWTLLFCQNIPMTFGWANIGPGHYWTLAIEEHFYLIWPLMAYYLSNKKLMLFSIVIVLAAIAVRFMMVRTDDAWKIYHFTFARMDSLAMGAIVAIAEPTIKNHVSLFRKISLPLMVFSALPVAGMYLIPSIADSAYTDVVKYTFIALSFAFLIVYCCVASDSKALCVRILELPALTYLGRISFGMYIYHILCFSIVFEHFPDLAITLRLILSWGLAIIVSHISYFYFERYFLKFKPS